MYSKEGIGHWLEWEKCIKQGKILREVYKPLMLFKTATKEEAGFYSNCSACDERLKADFGDYGKPLDEKFIECPNSKGTGHGIWASVLNIILN